MRLRTPTVVLALAAMATGVGMAGAIAGERTATLAVENLWCASCAYILRATLADTPGVDDVVIASIDRNDVGTTLVTFDDEVVGVEELIRIADELGYPATPIEE